MNPVHAVLLASLSLFLISSGNTQDEYSLSDVIHVALNSNRELQATRYDENASDFARWESISAYLPQVNFQSNTQKIDSDRFNTEFDASSLPPELQDSFSFDNLGLTGTTYNNRFVFQQLIFDRSVIGQINQANLRQKAAQWQTLGLEKSVAYQTTAAFLSVLQNQELLAVQRQRLALAEEQLDTARSGFEVGMRVRTDVLRAQLTRSSALRDIVSNEVAVERAQAQLNEILGIPLEARISLLPGTLPEYNPPEGIETHLSKYTSLFQIADMENPNIRVANILVQQSEEAIKTTEGEFYPRLSASGSWGWNEQGSLGFEEEEWSISGAITIPLFEGGRRIAKLRRTNEQLSAQEKRYEATVRSIYREIEETALSLQEETRNLAIAEEAAVVANENHERFLNLYEEGLADSLDVTQALTELVEAETNVVTTRYNYLILYAQLLQVTGTIPPQAEAFEGEQWLQILPRQE